MLWKKYIKPALWRSILGLPDDLERWAFELVQEWVGREEINRPGWKDAFIDAQVSLNECSEIPVLGYLHTENL